MTLKCETNLLQDLVEFNKFLDLIRENDVRSYLEVGSKHGGSLWRVANTLPPGSKVVSIDLPHGDTSFKESQPHLEACIEKLRKRGYDATLIIGDSTSPQVIDAAHVRGPFDLCFIDANHTEPYVWKDWRSYGHMARMIAFHDISHVNRVTKKMPIDVPKVWNQIKVDFRHVEIRNSPANNGIGVLWR